MIYNAKLISKHIIENKTEENRKKFKVYVLEETPKNMWKDSPLTIRDLNEEMTNSLFIFGIGYIISWPKFVRTFSFVKEHVNERRCFHPPKIKGHYFSRYPEMETGGCLAEEMIGGDEARFWLESKTLDEYFDKWSNALAERIVLSEKKIPQDF